MSVGAPSKRAISKAREAVERMANVEDRMSCGANLIFAVCTVYHPLSGTDAEEAFEADLRALLEAALASRPAAEGKLVEALRRIALATPSNTNSHSAESMASWTYAVAAVALKAHGGEE